MAVIQRGVDSNGRPVRETQEFWDAYDAVCDELGFKPTIVQGGHMGASAAAASSTTHNGDAADLRLWDRSSDQRARMIRVFRAHGFAYWERYPSQGFDLHAHLVPGPWASPSPSALDQFNDYIAGRNGLASNGADYHPRPTPLVTKPPQEDPMADYEAQLKRIEEKVDRLHVRADNDRDRDAAQRERVQRLLALAKDDKADRAEILREVQALADE